MNGPIALDFRPARPSAAAVEPWRDRIRACLLAPPPWLRLADAEVAAGQLAQVPIGPALLVGLGGSALGARAAAAWAAPTPAPLRVLDTLDDGAVADSFQWARELDATLLVVSKSGRTAEVMALTRAALRSGLAGVRVLVCDPGKNPLDDLLAPAGDYIRLEVPVAVGGRYSALTAVGQVPLRAAGLDPRGLLEGASAEAARLSRSSGAAGPSPAEELAAWLAFREAHPAATTVLWCYREALLGYCAWLQQLECESLGRTRTDGERVGELVTVLRGPADQHSVAQLLLDGPADKRVAILDIADDGAVPDLEAIARLRGIERDATYEAMTLPTARFSIVDRRLETLGALMLQSMICVTLWADHLGVDPYGEPGVRAIKQRVDARLRAARP